MSAANAIKEYLLSMNIHGSMIEIRYPPYPGYIVSILHNDMVISENGRHFGIEYLGVVFCNIHPYGLPFEEWLADFQGVGVRQVLEYPF